MLGRNASLQVHHIFPKAQLYKAGFGRDQVNAVANYCFLTQDANLEVLDRDPAEYFPAFEGRFPQVLASQWVAMDRSTWRIEAYPQFLAARRQLLADAVNDLLGELWRGQGQGQETVDLDRTPTAVVPDERDAEASLVTELIAEIAELGLAEGEIDTEVRRPESDELIGVAEACWPDGLLPGTTPPVVLELDGGEDQQNEMTGFGFLVFTEIAALRQYAQGLVTEAA